MSSEQRENLDAILRQALSPFGSDVGEQRRLLREFASAQYDRARGSLDRHATPSWPPISLIPPGKNCPA